MSCVAIIVAAGRGSRMGFDKLMATVAGRSVLQWSLDACLASPSISCVVVVTDADRFSTLRFPASKPVLRVDGGTERYHSVIAGLQAAPAGCSLAAIHDGARPLVRPAQIEQCIAAARETGAATLARPATETLKRVDSNGFTAATVSREDLWIMETPQVFTLELLRRAYERVLSDGLAVTDDVSAAETAGVSTRVIENPRPNPKVTVPADLAIVQALLQAHPA